MYLQNQTDNLWYPVTLTGTGTSMTLTWAETGGLETPPAYVPGADEPLIDANDYMACTGQTVIGVDPTQWMFAALYVSDAVESYCARSFRVAQVDPLSVEYPEPAPVLTSPPAGLRWVVAQILKQVLAQGASGTRAGVTSESLQTYSYTLAQGVDATSTVSAYAGSLKPYRRLHLFA